MAVTDMPSCTGCRTCEMACSFKNLKQFDPKKAAIWITENSDGIGFRVYINRGETEERLRCTGCFDCILYCPASDDLKRLIRGQLKEPAE